MKTDRFADIIRRKLDSIRPEFSERDWARMQATLKQAGPNPNAPTPSAHPFASQVARFAAAGAVGTAIFLTTTIWQHYEIKRLHQTIQTVSQKANRPDSAASANNAAPANTEPGTVASASTLANTGPYAQENAASTHSEQAAATSAAPGNRQRDTVYIDRYVTVPAPVNHLRATDSPQATVQPERRSLSDRMAQSEYSIPSNRGRNPASTQNQPARRADTQVPESDLGTGSSQQPNEAIQPEMTTESGTATTRSGKNRDRVAGNYAEAPLKGKSSGNGGYTSEPTRQYTTGGSSNGNGGTPVNSQSGQTQSSGATGGSGSTDVSQPVLAYETLAALPLQTNTVQWSALLAQRARRMRPARTTMVSGPTTVAAEPAVQRVQAIPFQFRVGAGLDVSSPMWSYGAYTEALILKHWSLSLGLSKATFATNTFRSPPDFDRENPEDFRKQYARALDPRFAIFDIQTYTTRIQLPINVGYRVSLSKSFTLLPTVGTNLNLQSQQYISFYHELPYKLGYEKIDGLKTQPIDLINNVTFGASVEWQTKHWAAQAGPLLTTPLQQDPGCLQNTSLGLRARVLYQF